MKPELLAFMFGASVGCIALIVTSIKQFNIRRHNRISTRPCLRIDRQETIDLPLKIILNNVGLGLAYIDRFEIQVDNILISGEYRNMIERVINHLGLNGYDFIFYPLNQGDEIEINEPYTLFEANPMNSTDHEIISSALHRMNYRIMYCSIYNETFVL